MKPGVPARRSFLEGDQRAFAAVSGDINPMHLDAVSARRTQAGDVVVHGVHGAMWALEALLASEPAPLAATEIEVRFRRFIYVGMEVELEISERPQGLRAVLRADGLERTIVDLRSTARARAPVRIPTASLVDVGAPRELSLEEAAGATGCITIDAHPRLAEMFPHAIARLGERCVQGMARLSTLVGVVCPGLHSIFDGFAIALEPDRSEARTDLAFSALDVDERFRLVRMEVAGPGFDGVVSAFVRNPPVTAATFAEARKRVEADEFSEIDALVVGGSRGLGSATAKAIVAGGGRVTITYHTGHGDAAALRAELGADRCRLLPYDATQPAATQLSAVAERFDQAYYFATPQIFREHARTFSSSRFRSLLRIYADGFDDFVAALRARGGPVTIFYPSSVYVSERPKKLTEYAMAKAAGEVLAHDLGRADRRIRILIERLPRVLTDQTSSVVPDDAADALDVMVPIVRRMRRASRPSP